MLLLLVYGTTILTEYKIRSPVWGEREKKKKKKTQEKY
jgi:hypothetical protein